MDTLKKEVTTVLLLEHVKDLAIWNTISMMENAPTEINTTQESTSKNITTWLDTLTMKEIQQKVWLNTLQSILHKAMVTITSTIES